jgi:hypothetical protein
MVVYDFEGVIFRKKIYKFFIRKVMWAIFLFSLLCTLIYVYISRPSFPEYIIFITSTWLNSYLICWINDFLNKTFGSPYEPEMLPVTRHL